MFSEKIIIQIHFIEEKLIKVSESGPKPNFKTHVFKENLNFFVIIPDQF
jgi:hypothetical protein